MRCCTVLQDPGILYWDEPLGVGDLRVVAASYGHKRDPRLALNVRQQLQARVVRCGDPDSDMLPSDVLDVFRFEANNLNLYIYIYITHSAVRQTRRRFGKTG